MESLVIVSLTYDRLHSTRSTEMVDLDRARRLLFLRRSFTCLECDLSLFTGRAGAVAVWLATAVAGIAVMSRTHGSPADDCSEW